MTTMNSNTLNGTSSTCQLDWNTIDWTKVENQVRRLQVRIAKAVSEGKQGKAKALQWVLSHSFSAKLLATKRVTQNNGSKTAGIDKELRFTTGSTLALERLEPCAGKLACMVLRGAGAGDSPMLTRRVG